MPKGEWMVGFSEVVVEAEGHQTRLALPIRMVQPKMVVLTWDAAPEVMLLL